MVTHQIYTSFLTNYNKNISCTYFKMKCKVKSTKIYKNNINFAIRINTIKLKKFKPTI